MDSVFGIGLPELILIAVLAGMLMGPERIVRFARAAGHMTARLQSVSRAFLRQLSAELDSTDADGQLRDTIDELQQLRRQVAELRSEVLTIADSVQDMEPANATVWLPSVTGMPMARRSELWVTCRTSSPSMRMLPSSTS